MALKPRTFRRVILIGSLASVVLLVLLGYFVVRPLQASRTLDAKRVDGMAAAESGDHVNATKLIGQYLKRAENPDPEIILTHARSRAKVQTSDGGYLQSAIKSYRRYLRMQTNDVVASKELLPLFNARGMYLEAANLGEQIRTTMNDQSLEVLREEIRARQLLDVEDSMIESLMELSVEDDGAKFVDLYKYVQWLKSNERTADANQFLTDRILADESDIDSKMSAMGLRVVEGYETGTLPSSEELVTELAHMIQLNPYSGEWNSEPLFLTREATVFLDSMFNGFGRPDLSLEVRVASARVVRDTDSLIWSSRRLYWTREFEKLAKMNPMNADDEPVADVIGYQQLAQLMDVGSTEVEDKLGHSIELSDVVLDFRAKAWQSFLRGVELLEQEKAVDARPLLTKALSKYPSEPTFHLISGDLSQLQGRFNLAVSSWDDAEQLVLSSVGDIRWNEPSIRIINAYWTAGRLVEIIDRVDELTTNPETFSIALQAYASLARSNNLDRAHTTGVLDRFEAIKDGLELDAIASIAPEIATLYASVGKVDSAREVLRVGFESEVDLKFKMSLYDVDAQYGLGLADEFGFDVSDILITSPDQALRIALNAYSKSQRIDAGLEILEHGAGSASDDNRFAWQTARAKYLDLFFETRSQAREAWDALRSQHPEDIELLYEIAESNAFDKDPDAVQGVIDQIVEITETVGKVLPSRLRLAHANAMVHENPIKSTRDRAIEIVRGVVSSEQQNIQARNMLGRLLAMRPSPFLNGKETFEPNITEAIEQYMIISRQLVGRSAQVYLLEAVDLAFESGDTDSAKQYLKEYDTRYFDDWAALPAAAQRLENMNELDDALAIYTRIYRRVLDRSFRIDAGLSMLNLFVVQNKRSQALTIIEEIKSESVLNVDQLVRLASLYAKYGFKPEGAVLAQSGERYGLNPVDSKLVYARYAKAFESNDAYIDALKEITATDPSNTDVWKMLIQHAINSDDRDQAKSLAAQAQAANPESTDFDALALLASGNIESVTQMLRSDENGQSNPYLFEAAKRVDAFIAAIETEPRETLIAMLVSMLDDFPGFKEIQHFGLEELRVQNMAPEQLAFYAGRAGRSLPSDSAILRIAGDAYILSGKPNEALDIAKLWRANAVGSPEEADILGARALIQFGQFDEAVSIISPYVLRAFTAPDEPMKIDVLRIHSHAKLMSGESPRDVADRLEPLLATSSMVRTQVWMNLVLTSLTSQDEAVRWLELVSDSVLADEQEVFGNTWVIMLENFDEPSVVNAQRAIGILESVHAIETSPNASSLGFLARAYAILGRGESGQSLDSALSQYQKAAEFMGQADQLDPGNLAYLSRGAYYATFAKDYALAENMYRQILDRGLESSSFVAAINNNLALVIEHQHPEPDKLEQALEMTRAAIKIDNQVRYRGTQGWIQLALKKLDSAEQSFRYVVDHDIENIEGWVGLAIVYNHLGADKAGEATEAFRQVIELTKSKPMSEELRIRLEEQGQPDWAAVFTN